MLFKKNDKIVFAGDSITDCNRLRPAGEGDLPANPYGNGYVALTFAYLRSKYPDLRLRIINQGISGDRSIDLLRRYDDILALAPDWIIIMIGVNDVWRHFDCPDIKERHVSLTVYEKNLEEMIAKNKERNIGTILLSPFVIEANREDPLRRMLDEYREALHQLARKHDLHYVDIQAAYDGLLREITSYEISRDRVHPNIVGHMLIMRAFIEYIEAERREL